MSHRDFYPRWIELPTGQKMVVQTHQQHSAMLGQEFDECANPVARRPKPPTVEEVLAAGYEPEAAGRVVAREQRKEAQGIEPYGDKPASEYVTDVLDMLAALATADSNLSAAFNIYDPALGKEGGEASDGQAIAPMPAPEPAEEEFPEPFYPPAAEIQPDAFADDPLGIFEPGPAEEEVPVGAAASDKPARRRGKNKE